MSNPTAIYWAWPVTDAAGQPTGALMPWQLVNLTPRSTDDASWARTAHNWAREDRRLAPSLLVAVRPLEAGPPVYPVNMADHYDLPPYS